MFGRRLDRHSSWTAEVCAAQRAAETLQPADRRLLDDPLSRHFVSDPALRAALVHPHAARVFIRALDIFSGTGFHAFMVLRAHYADSACEAAINTGIDQLVLLGAGFDTTGHRLPEASKMTVYEVDLPATQAHKRAVSERLQLAGENHQIVWVACDFEHSSVQERLLANGFDPKRPSLVVWIGVSLYLTRSAVDATLADLGAICASGSQLVLDYVDADVASGTTHWKGARRVAWAAARRGEPFRTGFAPTDLEHLMARHTFQCEENARVPALLERYAPQALNKRQALNDWQVVTTAQRI